MTSATSRNFCFNNNNNKIIFFLFLEQKFREIMLLRLLFDMIFPKKSASIWNKLTTLFKGMLLTYNPFTLGFHTTLRPNLEAGNCKQNKEAKPHLSKI